MLLKTHKLRAIALQKEKPKPKKPSVLEIYVMKFATPNTIPEGKTLAE